MSGSKGGGGNTQTVEKADPWSGIQPYLGDLYTRSQNLSYAPNQYYPGQTYAPLSPYQMQGLSGMLGYAGAGSYPPAFPIQTFDYQQPGFGMAPPSYYPATANPTTYATPTTSGTGGGYVNPGVANAFAGGGWTNTIGTAVAGLPQQTPATTGGQTGEPGGPYGAGIATSPDVRPGPSVGGMSLPSMNIMSQNSWANQLFPGATPAMGAGAALAPGATGTLANMMGGAGINGNVYAPQNSTNVLTPQIGFQPSTPQVGGTSFNLPQDTYAKMMSGQVDTGVYNNIADALAGRMTKSFTEGVLPSIRDEAIMGGSYGGSRQDLTTGRYLNEFEQNLGDALTNLYGGAYQTAMGQRATGAQLATTAGLGVGQTGANQAIEQARLGLGTQQLAGQLGTSQAQLGLDTQRLAATIGTDNANRVMQAQQLAQQGRTAEAQAILNAAGLSSDLITGAGTQAINQGENATRALALTPTMASMGMMPYDIMNQVGSQLQGQQQAGINEAMARYNYNQQAPWQSLGNYTAALSGVPTGAFGTSTSSTDVGTNPTANALGMGMSTAGLYAMGMMNPTWAIGLPLASYFLS